MSQGLARLTRAFLPPLNVFYALVTVLTNALLRLGGINDIPVKWTTVFDTDCYKYIQLYPRSDEFDMGLDDEEDRSVLY